MLDIADDVCPTQPKPRSCLMATDEIKADAGYWCEVCSSRAIVCLPMVSSYKTQRAQENCLQMIHAPVRTRRIPGSQIDILFVLSIVSSPSLPLTPGHGRAAE